MGYVTPPWVRRNSYLAFPMQEARATRRHQDVYAVSRGHRQNRSEWAMTDRVQLGLSDGGRRQGRGEYSDQASIIYTASWCRTGLDKLAVGRAYNLPEHETLALEGCKWTFP